jgi:hypothetical protein
MPGIRAEKLGLTEAPRCSTVDEQSRERDFLILP